jgi:hypothetical protein
MLMPLSRYLGKLGSLWKRLPRMEIDFAKKPLVGLHLIFLLVVASTLVTLRLPREVMADNKQTVALQYPFYRNIWVGMRLKKIFKDLVHKMNVLMPHRYTDAPYAMPELTSELGGNIGRRRGVAREGMAPDHAVAKL